MNVPGVPRQTDRQTDSRRFCITLGGFQFSRGAADSRCVTLDTPQYHV